MKLTPRLAHYCIIVAAFTISILFRLPNLNRPLSKHHEFNTAVILNGIISWKEGGGAAQFGYIPLMTYQGADNRLLVRGPHTDSVGNQLYLSLGAGWYVLPYLVFTALHLPFTPLSLQLLNLFFHLLTLLAIYRLGRVIATQYSLLSPHFPLCVVLVFLFLPGPLWFYGNGYVHNAISLPFAISMFSLFLQYLFGQVKLNLLNLATFALLGFTGIYFDWFTFFLLAAISSYSFWFSIKNKQQNWLWFSLFCGAIAIAAVGLVFWQFAHFLSFQQVVKYWTNRAGVRTVMSKDELFTDHIPTFFKNMVSSASISLAGIALVFFFFIRKKGFPALPFLLWLTTCVFYNSVFFNWSYNHDFSMVPLGVAVSLATAYLILQIRSYKLAALVLILVCMLNVVQYYFINPPGKFARTGTPYNQQKLLGNEISRRVPPGVRIFTSFRTDPMIEYYAHRSLSANRAETFAEAQHFKDSLQIPKAVWVQGDSSQITKIQWIP